MKKRHIFLHIGLPKTGSSALQECLTINAKALADHGVSYPFPESASTVAAGNCTGNLVHEIQRWATVNADVAIGHLGKLSSNELVVRRGIANAAHDKIVFSSEILSALHFEATSELFHRLARDYDVTLIAFVRDIYDQAISAWKQRVKKAWLVPEFDEHIAETVESQSPLLTENLEGLISAGFDVRLINYDVYRKDIFSALLREIGVNPATHKFAKPTKRLSNASLSYRQADQIVAASIHVRSALLKALLVNRFRVESDKMPDPYFQHIDKALLKRASGSIAKLNKALPASETLRDQIRDYDNTNRIDSSFAVMQPFLEAVREALEMQKNRPKFVPNKALPTGFDPLVYLLLNPDVEAAGVDPVKHYLSNGRYEGRKYS